MNISTILQTTAHRPWKLPLESWKFYQEWNNAIFLHWAIPAQIVQKYLPANMKLDTFEGQAYISLVAFTMEKTRPKNLPSMSFVSDFHEINVRTYVENEDKKGVYFLNIEAQKSVSTFLAKSLSGLPYEKASISRNRENYSSKNAKKDFSLNAEFEVKEKIEPKTELDRWLTERYCCLYVDKSDVMYRYEIHHAEWEIKALEMKNLELRYPLGELDLSGKIPDLIHYSEGVKVLTWGKQKTNQYL